MSQSPVSTAPARGMCAEVERVFRELLPVGVAVRAALVSCEQAVSNDGGVAPRRSVEHETGRRLAARALAALGSADTSVGSGARGVPLWPSGYAGSVTHTRDLCVVAVAPVTVALSIGIDLEIADDVDIALNRLICREDESLADASLAAYFSAKEAVFKCQYPLTGEDADFTDARLNWLEGGGFSVAVDEPRFAVTTRFVGRSATCGRYVLSAAFME